MNAKTWDDQPDEVEHTTTLGSFTITTRNTTPVHRGQVELRVKYAEHGNLLHWYLTAGNLFGSQTVKCESAAVVLNVLCNIGKLEQSLPSGAELLTVLEKAK
jgi:hypothetical protein